MKKQLLALLVTVLALFASTDALAGFTIQGTVRYNRNWSAANGYTSASAIPAAQRTGVHTLKDVQLCVTGSGAGTACTFTDANGNYSVFVNGVTGATYSRQIRFAGNSRVTPSLQGYRVVVSGSDSTVLTYNMSNFVGPAQGSTVQMGGHTISVCSTPSATCANDFANGHQVMQWAVSRWVNTFQFNTISGFNAAVDGLKGFTDRTNTLQCGFAGSSFCFNFDFGSTDLTTGWHEIAHTMLLRHSQQLGGGSFQEYVGQTSCSSPEEDAGGVAFDEGIANLNSILMGYTEDQAGTVAPLADFCFSSQQPSGDDTMNCSSCEYSPNANVYPQPTLVCGANSDFAIHRTECRVLRGLINLVDSQSSNTGCLNETVNLTFKQLWQVAASMPSGAANCSGCVHETQIGERGNAVSGNDAFSLMDVLEDLKVIYSVPATQLYNVWANTCYLPGEAGWAIGEFLPSSQQGTPWP